MYPTYFHIPLNPEPNHGELLTVLGNARNVQTFYDHRSKAIADYIAYNLRQGDAYLHSETGKRIEEWDTTPLFVRALNEAINNERDPYTRVRLALFIRRILRHIRQEA